MQVEQSSGYMIYKSFFYLLIISNSIQNRTEIPMQSVDLDICAAPEQRAMIYPITPFLKLMATFSLS